MTTTHTQRTAAPLSAAAPTVATSKAEDILAKAQSGRAVIQDFCPLAESLEWQLGQEYLRDRGNKAFIGDASPVPYVVNNDGTLSNHAAEVFYANLVQAEKSGDLAQDEEIFVLELGIGVGLFARLFLDAFRDLCWQNDKDFYDRLCYIAADRSERMLSDLCRHGVLAQHPGRYRVRQVDAMEPEENLSRDALFSNVKGPPLRAVFLNYLLDCLPAAVLEFDGDKINELHVRTCVARNVKLEARTDLKPGQLAERAKLTDAQSRRELLEVYRLFASEYDYRPADFKTLPYGDFAVQLAKGSTKYFLHSYGAIESLTRLMRLVHGSGFILINDYGTTELRMENQFEHQRFSLATFVGVNFAELRECFGPAPLHRFSTWWEDQIANDAPAQDQRQGRYCWFEPCGMEHSIHARLLTHRDDQKTGTRFLELFGAGEQQRLIEPVAKGRLWQQHGRFELANDEYREAIKLQPYNWVLLNEIANFLIFRFRGDDGDVYGGIKAGIDIAKLALAQNPTCSAELWSTLGDGLFEFGRYPEAGSAYRKALAVNEADVRARYNLAWVYVKEGDYAAALEIIGQAFKHDKLLQYRDRLLQKQHEALMLLAAQYQQEYLLMTNLVSRYAPAPAHDIGKPRGAADSEASASN